MGTLQKTDTNSHESRRKADLQGNSKILLKILQKRATLEDYENVYYARYMKEYFQLQELLLSTENQDEVDEILEYRCKMKSVAQ